MKFIFSIAILISIYSTNPHAAPAPHCGELTKSHDYHDPEKKGLLATVEEYHFTPDIEALRQGDTTLILGGEISYTLLRFPNHYRALVAFGKLSLKEKTLKPNGAKYSVECFFDRAIRFRPEDAMIRMAYGNYLLKAGRSDKATEQFETAISLQPEDPTINYNLGLIYMQKKNYELAKTYAKKAYGLGFPLPGLKNQLTQAGKWED